MPRTFKQTVRAVIVLIRQRRWWSSAGKRLEGASQKALWALIGRRLKSTRQIFDCVHRVKGVLQQDATLSSTKDKPERAVKGSIDAANERRGNTSKGSKEISDSSGGDGSESLTEWHV